MLSVIVIAGIPLTRIAFRKDLEEGRESEVTVWGMTIPIGLGVLSAILRIVTMSNVIVKKSAFLITALLLVIGIIYIVKNRRQFSGSCKMFWFALLIVIVVTGLGYFIKGADHYKAGAWWDLTFYASGAQDKIDIPISYEIDEYRPNTAYMSMAYQLINGELTRLHRFSLTTMNAFATVVSMSDNAADVLGWDIILSHILLFSCSLWVLRNIVSDEKKRLLLAIVIGCSPAIGFANQDCFLGFSLSVGIALMWGSFFYHCIFDRASTAKIAALALLFGYESTVFTEVDFLLIGITAVIVVLVLCQKKLRIKHCLYCILTFLAGFGINIQLWGQLRRELTLSRVNSANALDELYSAFALNSKGISLAMFGWDMEIITNETIYRLLAFVFIMLFFAGFVGVILYIINNRSVEHIDLLIILAFPLYFFMAKNTEIYMYYKMLLFCMPIIPIGLFCMAKCVRKDIIGVNTSDKYSVIWGRAITCFLVVVFGAQVFMTGRNTISTVNINNRKNMISEEWDELYDKYRDTENLNLFIVQTSNINVQFLKLYCKNDNLWVCDPSADLLGCIMKDKSYYQLDDMPDDVEIVRTRTMREYINDDELMQIMVGYCYSENDEVADSPKHYSEDKSCKFRIFSKENVENVDMTWTISPDTDYSYLYINDTRYEIDENGIVNISTPVGKGINEFIVRMCDENGCGTAFSVSDISVSK